ncbi:MAG: tRNA-dihydrouridine synthase [bacterium]
MNMWDKLFSQKRMILGLSPMDGVTDVAMRYMTAKYGSVITSPKFSNSQIREQGGVDILFTEFVSVDALHYASGERRERLLKTLMRARDAGPLESKPYEVAQVFGSKPEYFAEAAELIEKLGFDGIDINMGCPAHKVEENGSGAGLIRTPELAQEIIRTVKLSTKLPVSVKTRIGIDQDIAEEWMTTLMEVEPANISLHGRTLRQLYQGQADWEAIGRATEVVHRLGGHILGNGDVTSVQQAADYVAQYGVDGVLIGRAAEGNPGIYKSQILNPPILKLEPAKEQRFAWMVEHAQIFERIFGKDKSFMPMRKHLAWYCKGFPHAVELRTKLMQTNSSQEVEKILDQFIIL